MIAVIFALAGLATFAGGSMSWVFIALLIWGCFMLFGGSRRRQRRAMWYANTYDPQRRRRHQRLPYAVVPPDPFLQLPQAQPQPQPQPQQAPATPASRLPADVEQQVDRIRRKAAVLGQYADRFPLGSKDLFVVQNIESDYLKPTISAYLEVPSWSVETPAADGRTPVKMLHDQLDLLENKLDEVAEMVRNQRVDRLAANGRFLEERFGHQDEEELTIPRRPL